MSMHRFSGRWVKLAALLAILALIGPAVTSRVAAQATNDKVLRIHQITYPDVFDPQKSSFTNEIDILALAYEGLTRLDDKLETVPAAAESWEFNDDATQITFHLRDGLKFSDGSPLTAENFRYAVERTCDPNTAGQYQSILFEIKGCAEFAGLNSAGEGTPVAVDQAAYDQAKANLGGQGGRRADAPAPADHHGSLLRDYCQLVGFLPGQARDRRQRPGQLVEESAEPHWQRRI